MRGLGHLSGRGNTLAKDKMEGSADRRETNKSLIQLEHKVLGGEMRRGKGGCGGHAKVFEIHPGSKRKC